MDCNGVGKGQVVSLLERIGDVLAVDSEPELLLIGIDSLQDSDIAVVDAFFFAVLSDEHPVSGAKQPVGQHDLIFFGRRRVERCLQQAVQLVDAQAASAHR